MMNSHSQGQPSFGRGGTGFRTWDGYRDPNGTPVYLPEDKKDRRPDPTNNGEVDPIEAAEKGNEYAGKIKEEVDKYKKWQEDTKRALDAANRGVETAGRAVKRAPIPKGVIIDIFKDVFDPIGGQPSGLKFPPRPAFPPPVPIDPMRKPPGDQSPICGKEINPLMFPGNHGPAAVVAQFTLYRSGRTGNSPLNRIGSALRNTTREELEPYRFGIVKILCPEGYHAMFPLGEEYIWERTKRETLGRAGENKGFSFWELTWYYDHLKIVGTQFKFLVHRIRWAWDSDIRPYVLTDYGSGAHYSDLCEARLDCIVPIKWDFEPPIKPNDYDRGNDEDNMGCKWQKDEIAYELPRLKIGDTEIGGSSINIDDGLLPLAQYLCSAMKMMHSGIGLDLLDKTELPVNLTNKGGAKVKHKSLAELSQWQFDNVSSLVGLPVKNTITNLDGDTKDLQFKNIQDCLSYLVHHLRESDLDLMVVERYCTKIAQQLEGLFQVALRQQSDIEMIVQELGFKFKWVTETRPCLYKTGMKDDDEETGILELFKGGTVSYPVRKWDDELDQRQIALRTNLYAEIAAKAYLQPKNSKDEISGLDARIKMGKADKENWLEWVKTINTPEKGVTSGSTTPFIEEYDKGTIVAKAVKNPASGLSLFMKPVKPKSKRIE